MIQAKYTVVLKTLLDDPTIKPLIDKALSTYPLYVKKSKEEYIPSYIPTREELNAKILNHYKYREIGTETIEGFLDRLETTMIEIMPRYNLLYLTADQDFNIIYNVDYVKTIDTERQGTTSDTTEGTNSQTATSESSGTNTTSANDSSNTQNNINNYSKNVESTTPQGQLNIATKDIDSVNYADKASWNHNSNSDTATTSGVSSTESSSTLEGTNTTEGSNTITSNGANASTEGTRETTKGNFGVVSAQDLVAKYREIIINIDQMIINDTELSDLFMNVY